MNFRSIKPKPDQERAGPLGMVQVGCEVLDVGSPFSPRFTEQFETGCCSCCAM